QIKINVITKALMADHQIQILDETTEGLDPRQIVETRQVIRNLAGEHTVILSTHILPEVSVTCERVIIINRGKVAAIDTPENLQRRMKGSDSIEIEVRGPAEAIKAALQAMPQVLSVTERNNGVESHVFAIDCAVGSDL